MLYRERDVSNKGCPHWAAQSYKTIEFKDFCVGSHCSQWRWADVCSNPECTKTENLVSCSCEKKELDLGYCGMAGIPDICAHWNQRTIKINNSRPSPNELEEQKKEDIKNYKTPE